MKRNNGSLNLEMALLIMLLALAVIFGLIWMGGGIASTFNDAADFLLGSGGGGGGGGGLNSTYTGNPANDPHGYIILASAAEPGIKKEFMIRLGSNGDEVWRQEFPARYSHYLYGSGVLNDKIYVADQYTTNVDSFIESFNYVTIHNKDTGEVLNTIDLDATSSFGAGSGRIPIGTESFFIKGGKPYLIGYTVNPADGGFVEEPYNNGYNTTTCFNYAIWELDPSTLEIVNTKHFMQSSRFTTGEYTGYFGGGLNVQNSPKGGVSILGLARTTTAATQGGTPATFEVSASKGLDFDENMNFIREFDLATIDILSIGSNEQRIKANNGRYYIYRWDDSVTEYDEDLNLVEKITYTWNERGNAAILADGANGWIGVGYEDVNPSTGLETIPLLLPTGTEVNPVLDLTFGPPADPNNFWVWYVGLMSF